jgi:hypothetical protein
LWCMSSFRDHSPNFGMTGHLNQAPKALFFY